MPAGVYESDPVRVISVGDRVDQFIKPAEASR